MRSMGQNPTEDELLELVLESDLDGNGTIDFPEFLEMMKKKANEADQYEDLKEAFRIFDKNGDGYIDTKELKSVTTMLGTMLTKEEVAEFMAEADVVRKIYLKNKFSKIPFFQDGNGKLDYDEFVKIMVKY